MRKYKILAIIPARGGSKRIPRKNIRNFLGKPIIAYSIKTAIDSKLFDEVMVSTDGKEISKIAIKYGAKVPFFRSRKNSDDHAIVADVVHEVLINYQEIGRNFKYVFCIYPTAPFITAKKLESALKIIAKPKAKSVLCVTRFSYPIQRSLRILDNGKIKMFWPKNVNVRSQDLELAYHDSGQFFVLDVKKFLPTKKIFTDDSFPLIIRESEVQDIDTEKDWALAESKYKSILEIK